MFPPTSRRPGLARIAELALATPRRFLVLAALVAVAAGVFGVPVAKTLCACGFEDPTAESATASRLLTERFGRGDEQLLFVVSSPGGHRGAPARKVGRQLVADLERSPHVATVTSAWTAAPAEAANLVSTDGTAALVVAGITGADGTAQDHAAELADRLTVAHHDRDGVTVRAGGTAMVNAQITEQSQRDLLLMESLAIPLSFLVLVWVFGGLLTAAVPIAVGVLSVLGALAVLRAVTTFTDVSVFALNLSAAMGLALAIDYTLLMISRYRDEIAAGAARDEAVVTMMTIAGRTVLFSASIVALSMAMMALFPMNFLRSFAYAGVATVGFAEAAALFVTPAAVALLGDRLGAGRSGPGFLYRWTRGVLRRALPVGLAVVAVMLALGAPFLGVKWGFPDDRVLPPSASAHQVGDVLRGDFIHDSATAVTAVVPDAVGVTPIELRRYAEDVARIPDVVAVSPPAQADGSAALTIYTAAPLYSQASHEQLDRLHAVPGPAGRTVLLTGTAQTNRDSVAAITARLPLVLGLIAAVMFGLLFLLTGSVVIPLKALVLNMLSLTAAFGAMVWIFQDGHLGGLGTTTTGTLVANIPVLLFCIAFGLSMDYEVFLVSRIREFWLTTGDNDESVALGIAHIGRVVTAAAAVMCISFAALIAAQVSFMRMFGLGLTLAVLADATLIRMALMPAFMHLMGAWNWWAPKWLRHLHSRYGLDHGGVAGPVHPIVMSDKQRSVQ
ncbi:MMPL family transporter [Mycolicibacterium sp.]|uniref:MMPL family transporter n=1 Tax=Mycolicibacterium sp. TaxID=2320850 RepID=UPI003D0D73E4